MYEILVGKTAFPYTKGERELYGRIQKRQFDTSCPAYTSLTEPAKSLLNSMLTVDPTKRCSATEALKHPWIHDLSVASNDHLEDTHGSLVSSFAEKGRK